MLPSSALVWLLAGLAAAPTFEETLSQARRALKSKDLEAAKQLLAAAATRLSPPGQGTGSERFELLMARGEFELAADNLDLAARRYAAASHAAEDDTGRRRMAWQQRMKVARAKKSKRSESALNELKRHDEVLRQLWRRPRVAAAALAKAEAELQAAARFYQRDKDSARAAWARALAVRVRAYSGEDPDAALIHAAKAVHLVSKQPAYVQIAALEAAVQAAKRAGQEERELDYALRHNALVHRTLSEELRPYARTELLAAVCARVEKTKGPAACALRAHALTGAWNFQDFSLGKPRAQLEPQDLAAPNAQYLPAVADCVETIARENVEDELFQEARVKFEWVVSELGRVMELEISPKRYDRYFGECVRSAAGLFRYPRSTGERQTVSVSFDLSAPATRPRRGG